MALTKTDVINQIEIASEYKHIQIRNLITVKEDGIKISENYVRRTLNCGLLDADRNLVETDVSAETAEIQGIANTVWTQAVKDAWEAKLIHDQDSMSG